MSNLEKPFLQFLLKTSTNTAPHHDSWKLLPRISSRNLKIWRPCLITSSWFMVCIFAFIMSLVPSWTTHQKILFGTHPRQKRARGASISNVNYLYSFFEIYIEHIIQFWLREMLNLHYWVGWWGCFASKSFPYRAILFY